MPLFLRNEDIWARVLDPKTHLSPESKFRNLSISAASHRWKVEAADEPKFILSQTQEGLVDIAQSILERGIWTNPSWFMEQELAGLFEKSLGWEFMQLEPERGTLGFEITKKNISDEFKRALVTARWQAEATDATIDDLWVDQPSFDEGSAAERQFLEEVLVPVLGYPLLDYLRLQAPLTSLGLDPGGFGEQRTDFVIDTFRGFRLVIEVDGVQHQEPAQLQLDHKRDQALKKLGWKVWRVRTSELGNQQSLQATLRTFLTQDNGILHWGMQQLLPKARSQSLMTCVWGATVAARIQFLLLQSLREGILAWDEPWEVRVLERDTDIAPIAIKDFSDWFELLRELYGLGEFPGIRLVTDLQESVDLVVDIGITSPHLPIQASSFPIAWSRPANVVASTPQRRFSRRMIVPEEPAEYLITAFVQDLFRKAALRDGQKKIISRILQNQDVVGLLPTGGGKSLTYHLCGLLRGGMTVYVSPLKSLLQDQRERLVDCGIDQAVEISSALTIAGRAQATQLLVAGGVRFLLVSPERFLINQFRIDLGKFRAQWGEVSQVVIDECHCVSEWGHDFRPAYLSLSRIVRDRTNRLGVSSPLVALTGTASSIVLADVRRELGVIEDEAIVRAAKLDRPEIEMSCIKLSQKQKKSRIREIAQDFMNKSVSLKEGLLIFCRFRGSTEGVMNITSELLGSISEEDIRFYCGEEPDWKTFAAFRTRTPGNKITQQQIMEVVPSWATHNDQLIEWEQVKSKVQRDFISGLKGSVQVLVATNAFGMGIDKPSVRQVIHIMTPQSPEAYYQEVGRAGRDKLPSKAILLFSDEDAGVTDSILAPKVTIDEARQIYKKFKERNKWGGGDFIRTFYFHENSFLGPDEEAKHIIILMKEIRRALTDENSLLLSYVTGDVEPRNRFDQEKNLEYAIVRGIILGVVKDYTKDYNAKVFSLELQPEWEDIHQDVHLLANYYGDHFRHYVQKYQVNIEAKGEQGIRQSQTIGELEDVTATAIVSYVYEQIERKRREASRQMLELARKATTDQEGFRQSLMHYLQVSEKFTLDLEALARDGGDFLSWKNLLDRIEAPDEVLELHGACQRVIESYPTHSGLRAISAVTRRNPTRDERRRSEEEFEAALKFCEESEGKAQAKAMADAMVDYAERTDIGLTDVLQSALGIWLMKNGFVSEARQRFMFRKPVRDAWIYSVLKDINSKSENLEGW